MTPYHIAKIVDWAGTLESRKRMQKVIFLLQAGGCKALDAEFTLHHYGPYSAEVAALVDQMSSQGLLQEQLQPNSLGVTYSYKLTEKAVDLVRSLEEKPRGRVLQAEITSFEPQAVNLIKRDLSELEYGATVAYFFNQTNNWSEAASKACKFKKLEDGGPVANSALALAKQVVNGAP